MKLGDEEDELVQQVFDNIVHADVDRLAKQVKNFVYGVTQDQLLGDRIRVASEERIPVIVEELIGIGLFVRFEYTNHKPLLFHKDNVAREAETRRAFQLTAA